MTRKALIQLGQHRSALQRVERRHLLKGCLSLGALTMLTGCNLQDGDAVDRVLWAMSRWNDRVQAWLFDSNRLAPIYPASAITRPFPFNAFYTVDDAPEIDGDDYALEVCELCHRSPRSRGISASKDGVASDSGVACRVV
jgi:hypothetical protein